MLAEPFKDIVEGGGGFTDTVVACVMGVLSGTRVALCVLLRVVVCVLSCVALCAVLRVVCCVFGSAACRLLRGACFSATGVAGLCCARCVRGLCCVCCASCVCVARCVVRCVLCCVFCRVLRCVVCCALCVVCFAAPPAYFFRGCVLVLPGPKLCLASLYRSFSRLAVL